MPTIILSLLATARQWRGEREGKEGGGREVGGNTSIECMYSKIPSSLSLQKATW